MKRSAVCVALAGGALSLAAWLGAAQNNVDAGRLKPGRKYTTQERLEERHLAAVRAAREGFAHARHKVISNAGCQDVRAVIHVHAEDAPHTKGTRPEVLQAAHRAGVHVVMWSEHKGPLEGTWTGMREGVLFIAGAEEDHRLRFPGAAGDPAGTLLFLSHLEERPEAPSDGFEGMEIYNRHADQTDEPQFERWFGEAMKSPELWARLVALAGRYPDEVFAAACDYWPELTARWDRENRARLFTGIAANDSHQNQIYRGTTFDPYQVSFRNVSTHLLVHDLTDAEVRAALREGRAYVAHDWLCDPSGFFFVIKNGHLGGMMGTRIPLEKGKTEVVVETPLAANLRVLRDGAVVREKVTDSLRFKIAEAGVYRVEAWLDVDGELRPWIYSNPIIVAP
jgi:hypothetical protein